MTVRRSLVGSQTAIDLADRGREQIEACRKVEMRVTRPRVRRFCRRAALCFRPPGVIGLLRFHASSIA